MKYITCLVVSSGLPSCFPPSSSSTGLLEGGAEEGRAPPAAARVERGGLAEMAGLGGRGPIGRSGRAGFGGRRGSGRTGCRDLIGCLGSAGKQGERDIASVPS